MRPLRDQEGLDPCVPHDPGGPLARFHRGDAGHHDDPVAQDSGEGKTGRRLSVRGEKSGGKQTTNYLKFPNWLTHRMPSLARFARTRSLLRLRLVAFAVGEGLLPSPAAPADESEAEPGEGLGVRALSST